MNRTTRIAAAALGGVAVLASLGAGPASANNYHRYCSRSASVANMVTANNTTTAAHITVHPGGCGQGDWLYIYHGYKVDRGNSGTWQAGWHYVPNITSDSVTIEPA